MAAASSARQSQTYPKLVIHQAKPQPRFFTQILDETHTTNTQFFEIIGKEDTKSPFVSVSQADTKLPEYLAALGLVDIRRQAAAGAF